MRPNSAAAAVHKGGSQGDDDVFLESVADEVATPDSPLDRDPLDHGGENSLLVLDAQVITAPRSMQILDVRCVGWGQRAPQRWHRSARAARRGRLSTRPPAACLPTHARHAVTGVVRGPALLNPSTCASPCRRNRGVRRGLLGASVTAPYAFVSKKTCADLQLSVPGLRSLWLGGRDVPRVVQTVLFTDMVESTDRLQRVGDGLGSCCWRGITTRSAASSTGTAALRSTPPVTGSSPGSTHPRQRCTPPAPQSSEWRHSASTFAPASTPGRSSSTRAG